MKKLLVFFLFIVFTIEAFSQTFSTDSLVKFDELKYHSELEKEAFNEYFIEHKENYLKLFFAKQEDISKDEYLNKIARINNFINDLKEDPNFNKSNKKKVKYYYKKIHDYYLVKYEMNTYFPQIFENGNYNCVTGSILFGLIFDQIDIPYTIKVSPIHAYIVAYPNTESILVETTNPIKGYFVFNQDFKEKYVNHLRDSKLISMQEYNSSTIDALFDKHYFKEKDITLKELVGIQYYNDAITKIQDQKFDAAFYELEKAYLFYPSDEVSYLLYFTGAMALDKQDYSDLKYAEFLSKISRYKKYGITKDQIIGEFSRITQNQLDYKGNYELYDTIYNRLSKNINDTDIKKEIDFIYNYEKARLYIRNNRLDESYPYIMEALKIRPDHLDLQTMLIYSISNKLYDFDLSESYLDELKDLIITFPPLNQNKNFTDIVYDAYFNLAIQSYETGNITKALKQHKKINDLNLDNDKYSKYDYSIARLYSSAAVYYFRKGEMRKSKSMILDGLKIVPNNYELKARLRAYD